MKAFRYAGFVYLFCMETFLEYYRVYHNCHLCRGLGPHQEAPAQCTSVLPRLSSFPPSVSSATSVPLFLTTIASLPDQAHQTPSFLGSQLSMFETQERYYLPGKEFSFRAPANSTMASITPMDPQPWFSIPAIKMETERMTVIVTRIHNEPTHMTVRRLRGPDRAKSTTPASRLQFRIRSSRPQAPTNLHSPSSPLASG